MLRNNQTQQATDGRSVSLTVSVKNTPPSTRMNQNKVACECDPENMMSLAVAMNQGKGWNSAIASSFPSA